MKPGSSDRCPSKHDNLRCHKHRKHGGLHSAPKGKFTITWEDHS